MATLTSTVVFSKKAFLFGGVFFGGIILLFLLFRIAGLLNNFISPPPPPPAGVAFGKLPALDLSEGTRPLDDTQYIVETISGDLPALGQYAKVFEIAQPSSEFGDLEKAIEEARNLGFDPKPLSLSAKAARFVHLKDKNRTLTVDTINQSFSLESDFLTNPQVITSRPKSLDKIKEIVSGFFKQLNVLPEKFPPEKIILENYKIEGDHLEKAIALSDANLIKVIYNEDDIDGKPILFADAQNPLVWALATEKEVVAAQKYTHEIQRHRFATYPLKGEGAAYDELRAGGGILNRKQESNVFTIRNVILGYLETKTFQKYLQPVYVFVGDDNLVAMVSAISNSWIEPNTNPN